jgi:hypothetical protein
MGAYEASLLRSEASKPVSWQGQNAKINEIRCSLKTKNFLKDTLSLSNDTFLMIFLMAYVNEGS